MADDGTTYKNGDVQQSIDLKNKFDSVINGNNPQFSIKQESKYSSYSSDDSSDSPLDFSVKKKNSDLETSGRESVPSSTGDTCSLSDERKSLDPEERSFCSTAYQNGDLGLGDDPKYEEMCSESQKSPGGSIQPAIQGIAGMMSALRSGLVPHGNISNLSSMASLMDPRLLQGTPKSTRPFKAYPKDLLTTPIGSYGLTAAYNPLHGIDAGVLQNLNINSEELMNIYKRQLSAMNRTELPNYNDTPPRTRSSTFSSPTSTMYSPISTANNNNNNPGECITSSNGSHTSASLTQALNSLPGSGLSMGRRKPRSLPDNQKDEAYWERRRKNNDAAKRSRDARRAKEDEIAIRAALLEQENLKLRVEVAALKTETAKLRCILYNS